MRRALLLASALGVAGACGGTTSSTPVGGGSEGMRARTGPDPGGFVTYVLNKHVWRVEARQGAPTVDLSVKLDALSKGRDESPHVSKNGKWMTIATSRFGCGGDELCLAIVASDMSSGELV